MSPMWWFLFYWSVPLAYWFGRATWFAWERESRGISASFGNILEWTFVGDGDNPLHTVGGIVWPLSIVVLVMLGLVRCAVIPARLLGRRQRLALEEKSKDCELEEAQRELEEELRL